MTDALIITAPWSRFYTFYLNGTVEVRNDPSQADFEAAWAYVLQLRSVLNRWIGNLMCHADKAEWGGTDYITELMEATGRSRASLYQIHSTYSRLRPENQRDGVKYSYDLHAARLPPEQQGPMLDRVKAGDFRNSDVFGDAVRQQIKAPPRPTYPPPVPIPCPICDENGWKRERLGWVECPHCGTHGDEIVDKLNELLGIVREFYQTGARDELDAFMELYL